MTLAGSMCKDGLPLGVQWIIMPDCSLVQVLLNLLLLLRISHTYVTAVCLCWCWWYGIIWPKELCCLLNIINIPCKRCIISLYFIPNNCTI